MEIARLGELFDGLIRSVSQGMHPAVGADDGITFPVSPFLVRLLRVINYEFIAEFPASKVS
jgi:hypothetical protein